MYWYCDINGEYSKIDTVDPVTHWMYLPDGPINYNCKTGETN